MHASVCVYGRTCVGARARPITATTHTHFCTLANAGSTSSIHTYIHTFLHISQHFPPAVFPVKHQFFRLTHFFYAMLVLAVTSQRPLHICNNILHSSFSLLTSSMCLLPELPFYEYTGRLLTAHVYMHIYKWCFFGGIRIFFKLLHEIKNKRQQKMWTGQYFALISLQIL